MPIRNIKKSIASTITNFPSQKLMPKRVKDWAATIETLAMTNSNYPSESSSSSSGSGSRNLTPSSGLTTSLEVTESPSSSLPVLELDMDVTKMTTRSCLKKAKQQQSQDANIDTTNNNNNNNSNGQDDDGTTSEQEPKKRVVFAADSSLMTCLRTGMHLTPEAKTALTVARFFERSDRRKLARAAYKTCRRLAREAAGKTRAEDSSTDEDDAEDAEDAEDADKEPRVTDGSPSSGDLKARIQWQEQEQLDFMGPFDAEEQAVNDLLRAARESAEVQAAGTVAGGGLDFALYTARSAVYVDSLESIASYYCPAYSVRIAAYLREERPHANAGALTDMTEFGQSLFGDYENSMLGDKLIRMALLATETAALAPPPPPSPPTLKREEANDRILELVMPTANMNLDS